MKVRLISFSQPTKEFLEETGMKSLEDLIAYAARVSNPSNQVNKETAPKLIRYLINNSHWSPLEMVSATMEIETTRDIARQILRHRSFSFQEFSQRYADPTDLGMIDREARLQDPKNRQNSIEVSDINLQLSWENRQHRVISEAQKAYEWAIEKGIAKEQARAVLPEGLTVSRMYMSGTLRSWVHYIQLRAAHGTQKEHQQIAVACADALATEFPMIRDLVKEQHMDIKAFFRKLRFDNNHHLGLGDVHLTLGQQEDIIAAFEKLAAKLEVAESAAKAAIDAAQWQSKTNHELNKLIQERDYLTTLVSEKVKHDEIQCWCHVCNKDRMVFGVPYSLSRMVLCPECGNKRCPKATNHELACTNSNESGQAGSIY